MVSLRIALRYLFSKKSHNAVNIISLISLAGVAVATMATVCVLSVFNGFSDLASSLLSRLDPDLKITATNGKVINNADSLALAVENIDGVELALPTIQDQALAIFRNYQMPVTLKGVPRHYDSLTQLPQVIIDGQYIDSDSTVAYATLSAGAAIGLKATPHIYDCLGIYTPRRKGRINPANPLSAFRSDTLAVGAVFQVNQAEYDTDMIIVPLSTARQLLDYTTQATAIEVKATDPDNIAPLAHSISTAIGNQYEVKDRLQQQQQTFRMIEIEKWVTFLMLAFILIIASFNIISTLSMLVIEKSDNIATLRALGASQPMISRIFTLQGWLISIVGGIAGIIIGTALSLAQQYGRFIKLSGDPMTLTTDAYPVRLAPFDLLIVMVVVIVIGFITAQATALFTRNRTLGK